MIDAVDIGDRHSLPADGLADVARRESQSIRIVMSEAWANSRAGQLLASSLVNLLCRQPGLIASIEIVAAAGPFLIRLPNGQAVDQEFPGCLGALVQWAVKDKIIFSSRRTERHADHTIAIGEGCAVAADQNALFVIGTGWRAWIGRPERAPQGILPRCRNPLGPFLAAALAAGEIFKASRGILRGRLLEGEGFSLWSGESGEDWDKLQDGPEVAGLRLGAFHLIGAGAVGNDLAYILANMEPGAGYAAVIDDDAYDGTSLNRCLLAGWQDVEHPKVDPVAAVLRSGGIGAFPFPGTIKDYLNGDRTDLYADLAREVEDLAFDIVVSCVDRGVSRQDIQGLGPTMLMGASTLGLSARANFYPVRAGAACLACFNPAERDGEKIRALEKQLREMPREERVAFLEGKGIDAQAVEKWLADPRCGGLGEAAVRDLATRTPSEFSVGFVSLGAALLLGSMLLRETVLASAKPKRGDMNALNFLNGRVMDSFLAPDDACQWECQKRRANAA
jgi:hypothetical protein